MKKNFLYSMVALFVCLFTACSQEEIVSQAGQNDSKVRLSVKVPAAGPIARAALDIEGYTMQCIMELVNTNGEVIADSRQAVTVSNGAAHFEFDKPSEEYTCLFWAEYLKEGKSFYKTSTGLTKISYDGNKKNELFNNTAADAFCGKLASSNIAAGVNVILKRPFARIAVSKTDFATLGTGLNQCTASIFSGTDFNVFTGKVADTVNIKNTEVDAQATPISIDADSEYPFFCYVFIGEAIAKPSNIIFSNSENPDSKKTLSITADQMKTMSSNTAVNLKPETGGDNQDKINVDITIDNGFENGGGGTGTDTPTNPETPVAVEVGDYLYADGTWGKTAENAVAVVFALAENDATTNYANITFPNNKINGWAVSINQTAKTAWTSDVLTTPIEGMVSSASQDDILGYKNTKAAGNQLAISAYNEWATVTNTSGWYIPAIGQLAILVENATTINTRLAAITDAQQIPPTGTNSNMNFWSSTFNDGTGEATKIYQYQYKSTDLTFTARSEKPSNSAGVIRPILTF